MTTALTDDRLGTGRSSTDGASTDGASDDLGLLGLDPSPLDRSELGSTDLDPSRSDDAVPDVSGSTPDAAALDAASTPAARSSFPLVVGLFIALAIVQVALVALMLITFELAADPFTFVVVAAAPSLLYGIVAAWDARQLSLAGLLPIPWWLAVVFPPLYLFARWRTAATDEAASEDYSPSSLFGWVLVQCVMTAGVLLLAVTSMSGSFASAAAPVDEVPTEAFPFTSYGVEESVLTAWDAAGIVGNVSCPEVDDTTPGASIVCTATMGETTITFTAVATDAAVTGSDWQIGSWSAAG